MSGANSLFSEYPTCKSVPVNLFCNRFSKGKYAYTTSFRKMTRQERRKIALNKRKNG